MKFLCYKCGSDLEMITKNNNVLVLPCQPCKEIEYYFLDCEEDDFRSYGEILERDTIIDRQKQLIENLKKELIGIYGITKFYDLEM